MPFGANSNASIIKDSLPRHNSQEGVRNYFPNVLKFYQNLKIHIKQKQDMNVCSNLRPKSIKKAFQGGQKYCLAS